MVSVGGGSHFFMDIFSESVTGSFSGDEGNPSSEGSVSRASSLIDAPKAPIEKPQVPVEAPRPNIVVPQPPVEVNRPDVETN